MAKVQKQGKKPRVVLDSNIWISALVFGGLPGKVLELFISEDVLIITSEELLSELRRKIIQKFPLYISQINLLEASIRKDAILVPLGSRTVTVSRDPEDN